MEPYSADDIKRRKRRNSYNLPGTSYDLQLGRMNDKWAIHLLKDKDAIDSYVFKEEDMSVSGFPNENLIVGWVLRTVAIPNINPHLIMKTVHAMTKDLIKDRNDHLPYPSIYKPPVPPDDIGVATNVARIRPVKENESEVELFCRYCGSELAMDESFCSVCGKKS